ncbi:hypothetical protein KAR91_17860 [Candidatus Pacearchaeota archaeon]|nr:hypothetical protein [Candidatus Pacearchaeota archaeon]
MKTVTVDKITVEVRQETIRARMHSTTLNANSILLMDEIAEEVGVTKLAIAAALADFVLMSPRVKVVKGKLDFEFPAHNVSSEQFKINFLAYLDSDYLAVIDQIIVAINELDRAQNPNLLPGMVLPDNEKKS